MAQLPGFDFARPRCIARLKRRRARLHWLAAHRAALELAWRGFGLALMLLGTLAAGLTGVEYALLGLMVSGAMAFLGEAALEAWFDRRVTGYLNALDHEIGTLMSAHAALVAPETTR